MRISLIVAMDRHRVIGHLGKLPWHLPADLRHFKQMTWGKPLLMGRVTYESIGRPLPGRHNIVLTRTPQYLAPGCSVATSVIQALEMAGAADELMVIGGAEVYRQTLCLADRIILTEVQADLQGDAFFPQLDSADWQEISCHEHPADAEHRYALRFLVLKNRAKPATANKPSNNATTGRSPCSE